MVNFTNFTFIAGPTNKYVYMDEMIKWCSTFNSRVIFLLFFLVFINLLFVALFLLKPEFEEYLKEEALNIILLNFGLCAILLGAALYGG